MVIDSLSREKVDTQTHLFVHVNNRPSWKTTRTLLPGYTLYSLIYREGTTYYDMRLSLWNEPLMNSNKISCNHSMTIIVLLTATLPSRSTSKTCHF